MSHTVSSLQILIMVVSEALNGLFDPLVSLFALRQHLFLDIHIPRVTGHCDSVVHWYGVVNVVVRGIIPKALGVRLVYQSRNRQSPILVGRTGTCNRVPAIRILFYRLDLR